MFFSLTAVAPRSTLLCRKQALRRFIFSNGLEIKRAPKCASETQLGDWAALRGDFFLQVLRIGTKRAGQRHSGCVHVKPKQVFEK